MTGSEMKPFGAHCLWPLAQDSTYFIGFRLLDYNILYDIITRLSWGHHPLFLETMWSLFLFGEHLCERCRSLLLSSVSRRVLTDTNSDTKTNGNECRKPNDEFEKRARR